MQAKIYLLILVGSITTHSMCGAVKRNSAESSIASKSRPVNTYAPEKSYLTRGTKSKSASPPGPALVAIQIIDEPEGTFENGTKKVRNSKRTIESSLGYGGYNGNNFYYKTQEGKFEVYPYSQHDIPAYDDKPSIEIQKSHSYSLGTTTHIETTYPQTNGYGSLYSKGQQQSQPPTLFSTFNHGHFGSLSATPFAATGSLPTHNGVVLPVIVLKIYTSQLTDPTVPIYANLPANSPYASYVNSINLQTILAQHLHQNNANNGYSGYNQHGYTEGNDHHHQQQQQQNTYTHTDSYTQNNGYETTEDHGLDTSENYPSDTHTQVIFQKTLEKQIQNQLNIPSSYNVPPNSPMYLIGGQAYALVDTHAQNAGKTNYDTGAISYQSHNNMNIPLSSYGSQNLDYSSQNNAYNIEPNINTYDVKYNTGYEPSLGLQAYKTDSIKASTYGPPSASYSDSSSQNVGYSNSVVDQNKYSPQNAYSTANVQVYNSGATGYVHSHQNTQQEYYYPQNNYQDNYSNQQEYAQEGYEENQNEESEIEHKVTVDDGVKDKAYNYHAHPVNELKYKRSESKSKSKRGTLLVAVTPKYRLNN